MEVALRRAGSRVVRNGDAHPENLRRVSRGRTSQVGRGAGAGVERDALGLGEEEWSAPLGGSMMGVYRETAPDGAARMCELLTITAESPGVLMRLRHHTAQLAAREEKDKPLVLRLESCAEGRAIF